MDKSKNRLVILHADRPRVLKASHKALKMISKMLKKSINEVEIDGADFDVIEKVVYCLALKDAQKNGETMTLEQMEDILDAVETEQEIIDAVADAFSNAFPEKEAAAKVNPTQVPQTATAAHEQDGTGTTA